MPYMLEQVKQGGFFVKDKAGHRFSKKPLTKTMATKQRIAIAISESKRKNKLVKNFFV